MVSITVCDSGEDVIDLEKEIQEKPIEIWTNGCSQVFEEENDRFMANWIGNSNFEWIFWLIFWKMTFWSKIIKNFRYFSSFDFSQARILFMTFSSRWQNLYNFFKIFHTKVPRLENFWRIVCWSGKIDEFSDAQNAPVFHQKWRKKLQKISVKRMKETNW